LAATALSLVTLNVTVSPIPSRTPGMGSLLAQRMRVGRPGAPAGLFPGPVEEVTLRPPRWGREKRRKAVLELASMALKDQIRRLRIAAGLTQQQLATQAGLAISSVIHMEKGRAPNPRLSTLRALAKVLNCGLDELTKEEEPPQTKDEAKPRGGRKKGGAQ
jgi:DNA-binding XRE family transcriptional regulator